MAWDHPVPQGRWAALHDEAFWVPMLGIVSRVVRQLGFEPERAGTLIAEGMANGEIAHAAEGGHDWIVAPRGAEIARQFGFSYETMLDWKTGCMIRPGDRPREIRIFWPDVERVAKGEALEPVADPNPPLTPRFLRESRPSQASVDAWIAEYHRVRFEAGQLPPKRDLETFPACLEAIFATDAQMKAAMQKVPAQHKRRRGEKDRANRGL